MIGTARDQHPPLHYLILAAWQQLVGSTPYALRLFSVIVATLGVALAGRLAVVWFGRPAGWIALALMATLPFHIWYSQEARMYALLATMTIASFLLLDRIAHRPTFWPYLGYVVLAAAMLYTQYYAMFVIATQSLIWLLIADRLSIRACLAWIAAQCSVALLFLPWLPVFLDQITNHKMTWLTNPGPSQLALSLVEVITGLRLHDQPPAGIERTVGVAVALVCLGAVVLTRIAGRGESARNNRVRYVLTTELWFLVPLGMSIAVTSLVTPIFQEKHLLSFLPGLILAGAALISLVPHFAFRGLLLLIVIVVMSPGINAGWFIYGKQDWRGVTDYMLRERQSTDIVLLNPGAASLAITYFARQRGIEELPVAGFPFVFDAARGPWVGERATAESVRGLLDGLRRDHRRIWLIQYSSSFWDPEGQIVRQLRAIGQPVAIRQFRSLDVQLYDVPPP